MSENQTIARPYAHAVFELAQQGGDFAAWSEALAVVSATAADEQIQELASNPRVDDATLAKLFDDIGGDALFAEAKNFVRLVIQNDRVSVLPHIASQYEHMRAEAQGTIEAELHSALAVSEAQQANIAKSLSKRLGREVTLRVVEDPDLIGGAVLRAGDLVIDASVTGRLQKLSAALAR